MQLFEIGPLVAQHAAEEGLDLDLSFGNLIYALGKKLLGEAMRDPVTRHIRRPQRNFSRIALHAE